jgi:tRNA(fMet)-specific endonuclease VapC
MAHILDTTALSALMRGEGATSQRLLHQDPNEVTVPQPVLAELRYGLARLPKSRRRAKLEERLEILLRSLERAPWTDDVSRTFGELKAELEKRGKRVDDFDVAIAAHALALGATLVTQNIRHFERIPGLAIENWSTLAT